jgi:hypothetical protein
MFVFKVDRPDEEEAEGSVSRAKTLQYEGMLDSISDMGI